MEPLHPRPTVMVHYNADILDSGTVPAASPVANGDSRVSFPAGNANNFCMPNNALPTIAPQEEVSANLDGPAISTVVHDAIVMTPASVAAYNMPETTLQFLRVEAVQANVGHSGHRRLTIVV